MLPATLIHPLPLSGYYDRLVGTHGEVEQQLQSSCPPPAGYRALSPEQCQCMAVKASSEGNRMATERRVLVDRASPHGLSEKERLKLQVLWSSEMEARNRSAAVALTTYYRIAQSEANLPLLKESLAELDEALAKVDRIRANGLTVPFDDSELRRRRLEMVDQQLKLISQLDQLNAELVQLIGASTTEARPRLWPATDFTVNVAAIDIDQAVLVGLAMRPELRLLASLQASLTAKNVSVTRGVVGGPTAMAMLSIAHFCKLIKQCRSDRRELPTRDWQLAERYDQRRREVTAEIQQAVIEVASKLERIAVEKELVSSWQVEREKLWRKKQIDEATFVDATRAKLKWLEAKGAEAEQIVDWKIALVKVKQGQGLLVAECLSKNCRFLDVPVEQHPPSVPPAEFIVPEEILPGSDGHPELEAEDPELRASSQPLQLPAALPLSGERESVDAKSAVTRFPASAAAAEPSPPDMAVEPISDIEASSE